MLLDIWRTLEDAELRGSASGLPEEDSWSPMTERIDKGRYIARNITMKSAKPWSSDRRNQRTRLAQPFGEGTTPVATTAFGDRCRAALAPTAIA